VDSRPKYIAPVVDPSFLAEDEKYPVAEVIAPPAADDNQDPDFLLAIEASKHQHAAENEEFNRILEESKHQYDAENEELNRILEESKHQHDAEEKTRLAPQQTALAHLADLTMQATAIVENIEDYCPTRNRAKAHQQLQALFQSAKQDVLEEKPLDLSSLEEFIQNLLENQLFALIKRAKYSQLLIEFMDNYFCRDIRKYIQDKKWRDATQKLSSFSDHIDDKFRSSCHVSRTMLFEKQDKENTEMLNSMDCVDIETKMQFAQEMQENNETDPAVQYKKKLELYNKMKVVKDGVEDISSRESKVNERLWNVAKYDHGPLSLSSRGFVYIISRFEELAALVRKNGDLMELDEFTFQEVPQRVKVFSQIYSQETFFTELKSEAEKIIVELEKNHQDCTRAREILGEWVTAFEGINRNSSVHDYGFPQGWEHFNARNRMSSALHGLQVFKDLQQERLENVKKRRPMEAFEIDESEMMPKKQESSLKNSISVTTWGRSKLSAPVVQVTPAQVRTSFALRPGESNLN